MALPAETPGRRRGRLSAPWGDTEPIRSEIFSPERFEEHARSLADSQTVVHRSRRVVSFPERLEADSKALARSYEAIAADVAARRPITPAAEWLIDNYHQVETTIRQVRRDLPDGYFRQLPKLGAGFLEGHPRIFGILWAYVAHTDSRFDPDLMARYIRAYESRKALTLGELWAVAITMRFLLVENLRRQADLLVQSARERHRADVVADGLLGLDGPPRSLAEVVPDHENYTPSHEFAVQLLGRLGTDDVPEAAAWVTSRLAARGLEAESVVHGEHQRQARATVTMRNIFTSLRLIADVNWEDWVESVSLIEVELRAGNDWYRELDFPTRNMYRSAIEDLARGARQQEIDVARAALIRAEYSTEPEQRDLGYWLIGDGRDEFVHSLGYRLNRHQRLRHTVKSLGLAGYLATLTLGTAVLLALVVYVLWRLAGGVPVAWLAVIGVLLAVPLSEVVLAAMNYWTSQTFNALPLPSLALRDGVPSELRTLVAVPTMITSAAGVNEMLEGLEVHYLANNGGEVYFALVTDWADAPDARRPHDDELLDLAVQGIRRLNRQYGDRFFLFHRERQWNEAEGTWMGWERKRGKLTELNRHLKGEQETSFIVAEGRWPGRFRYVITLDSDTLLPREAARRLVGRIAHPMNRAHFDPRRGRVVKGYGILQPRVTPALPLTEGTSLMQRIYSTPQGRDSYAFAVSDAYQDLFGEGSFSGKGIYDIDAVEEALAGKVPENSLLSHDLLEGNYSRSGLVTDVEVVEDNPTSYAVMASRSHRWIRGDWQLLPWMAHPGSGLSGLGRWKMVDNLRRSLVPVMVVAVLLVGLAVLPGGAAAWLGAVLLGLFFIPPLLFLFDRLFWWRREVTLRSQFTALAKDVGHSLLLAGMNLVLTAHQAWLSIDAIARTLWRLAVSHRNLLEWTTAAAAARNARHADVAYYARLMAPGMVAGALALIIGAVRGPALLAVAAVPALAWLVAPVLAQRASRVQTLTELEVTAEDRDELRQVARRTWRFFETFITETDNYLPPDNFQEDPVEVVAHRTSPTNIGLYLLTVVAARDAGWIGLAEATERMEAVLRTVARLELFRGHLYNWYDTRTLEPLQPRYVSAVDSGNLAGHLLVVANACREWIDEPDRNCRPATGLRDAVLLLEAALQETPDTGRFDAWAAARTQVRELADRLDGLADRARLDSELPWLTAAADQLRDRMVALCGSEAAEPVAWAEALQRSVHSLCRDTEIGLGDGDAFPTATAVGHRREAPATVPWTDLVARLSSLESSCRRLFAGMDFEFLYDKRRSLLSIGYQVDNQRLENSNYDMLASEARLASFVAIAKGDLRTRHWSLLGRTVTAVGSHAALQSWSGSMFEYLMPSLVMRAPVEGLLGTTARLAVRRQIEYGNEHRVPWGVSEAAYNARDREFTYQYGPFGVPGLGVVRGLANDLVIAPYATGLAAMVEPAAAVRNYRRLDGLGAKGRFGFYESLDFTRSRLPEDRPYSVVRCFMAHHQGMTIVAIHNAVNGGVMRDRFHTEPMVEATELLLQERAPKDVPVTHTRRDDTASAPTVRGALPPTERLLTGAAALAPAAHHLSNGRLSVTATAAAGIHVRWNGNSVTRWHPDQTTPPCTDVVYLRDRHTERTWTATAMPSGGDVDGYEVRFSETRGEYVRTSGSLRTELDVVVSPEADAVVRRLTIRNASRHERVVDVTQFSELALQRMADDDAHPVFSKMFVYTEYLPDKAALVATRRRRSDSDPEIWAASLCYLDRGAAGPLTVETDRSQFLGRGNSTRNPQAMRAGAELSGTTGYVLDPVFALRQPVRVPAEGRVRLYFWTVVAATRDEVLRLIDQHRNPDAYDRTAMLAWTESQVQLRHLSISTEEAGLFQRLASHVMFPHPLLRQSPERLARDGGSQADLWSLGVSGDLPIITLHIDDEEHLAVARQLVRAFDFWRLKRVAIDIVLLNDRASTYVQELHWALEHLASSIQSGTANPDSPGRVFVVRADQVAPHTISALLAASRVVLDASKGELAQQVPAGPVDADQVTRAPEARPAPAAAPGPPPAGEVPGLLHDNGYGGFSADGREYLVVLDEGRRTPAPWTNVVANEQFGFHATAEGAGYTWWRNSRDNQLTPWRNDPVASPMSEVLYVHDVASGQTSTPTAAPIDRGRHLAWHGFGYTGYYHDTGSLHLDLRQFLGGDDPVKLSWLRVTNRSDEWREVIVTWYAEPVLGLSRHQSGLHLRSQIDPDTQALFIRNPWSTAFADQVVFADFAGQQATTTTDRREFLGLHGDLAQPAAVLSGSPLSGRVGAGYDTCAAMQQRLGIDPGATVEVLVVFGAAHDEHEARQLVAKYRDIDPQTQRDAEKARWDKDLSQVQVQTPDSSFDVMMNGWLLYQSMACRMMARSGYYQTSGAYGFRDQLQDSMAVVLVNPDLARHHLLSAAARQFPEGDVQHWWLPATGMGVRTRISDDVVWLAHVTARYIEVTGDTAVLDEQVPFLEGDELTPDQHENFFLPKVSGRTATLYDHCVLGLRRSFTTGRHGLPLIGTGDWNDGMNRVGQHGEGESVWLGWFQHATLSDFLPLVESRGDAEFADECRARQAHLLEALETHGWDGRWYRRGYFDDGTPLGSHTRTECRIDAIAQSWAVLSGAARSERAMGAMEQVDQQLVSFDEKVHRLFTPPFDRSDPDPGYIRSYPPGVRENGGQYTHGVIWSIFAHAKLRHQDRAGALFSLLNPVRHAETAADAEVYRVEPYVVAADVYSVAPHVGRGGWTWYTGSAGWLYRAGLEAVLGLRKEGDYLVLEPCLPADWDGASVRYDLSDHGFGVYDITLEAKGPAPRWVTTVELDGVVLDHVHRVPLAEGRHQLRVVLTAAVPADGGPATPRPVAAAGSDQWSVPDLDLDATPVPFAGALAGDQPAIERPGTGAERGPTESGPGVIAPDRTLPDH